jgi:hypothetical protein
MSVTLLKPRAHVEILRKDNGPYRIITLPIDLTGQQSIVPPTWLPDDARTAVNYTLATPRLWRATRTFSRASTGTYLDADGVLQTAAIGALRINYGAGGVRLGALFEAARTNIMPRSNYGSGAGWTAQGATNFSDVTGPDGQPSSAKQADLAAGKFVAQITGVAFGANTYAAGMWLRTPVGTASATLDLSSSGVRFITRQAVTITSDWQRFSSIGTGLASDTGRVGIAISAAASAITIQFANATVEKAASVSSYIATSGSAATRAADVETISPTDQSSSFDWYARYDDDTEGKIASAVTGDFEVDPANLSRPNVKLIWAQEAA